MSYKTILVHLDKKSVVGSRVRIAAKLAIQENACLIGAAMIGISTQTFQQAHIDEKDPALASHLQFLRDRTGALAKEFEDEVRKIGVSSYEGRVVDGEANQGISLQGRVVDLIVIGRADSTEKSSLVSEYVMMNSGRPVLIIPPEYQKDEVGKRVMICWNASRESIRAVADAVPILKRAELVQIVMYNIENEPDVDAELAGGDVALYLSRHGVNVEILPPQTSKHVGTSVLELGRQQAADLLVMGGYGHTRFRELLLGGVTRTVLSESDIPVLMSH